MNGLSDSLTIGIVITLVFGALFFYLYSRLSQNEKRVSLIENILLDLKMSADAGWGVHGVSSSEDMDGPAPVDHVEPVSGPEPLNSDDVDSNDEDVYKNVLAQVSSSSLSLSETGDQQDEVKSFDVTSTNKSASQKGSIQVTKIQANYEAMSNKELKNLAKQRGVNVSSQAQKKELISALRKADGNSPTSTPSAAVEGGSFLGTQQGASLEGEPLGEVETL